MANSEKLKLDDVLTEIKMSRAAFYRMRARGQAPRISKLPNGQLRVSRADLDAWWAGCEERAA
ncbi:helix-turn-helix transcriptional regulator [Streptomyces sp. NPDC059262]|uniref:helix-turn-helix transcriptional regulator n=1 Tax=Streptomyces sp. NPDC059262 TaxID=3346797 RepID=UPI00369E0553